MTKPHQKCDLKAVASDTRLNYLVWKGLWDNLTDDGFLCRKHPRCEEDNPSWWWVPSNPRRVIQFSLQAKKVDKTKPISTNFPVALYTLYLENCRGRGGARSSPICPDLPQVPPPRPPSTKGLYQVNIPFFLPLPSAFNSSLPGSSWIPILSGWRWPWSWSTALPWGCTSPAKIQDSATGNVRYWRWNWKL